MSPDKMKVKDAYDPQLGHCEILRPEESLHQLILKFAERADMRGFFVADTDGKLLGVVTRIDLLNFAKFKLGGHLQLSTLRKFVASSQVKDVIHPYSWGITVKPEDDLLKALDLMVDHDLIDVPVVDQEGRIVGELKLSDILIKILE